MVGAAQQAVVGGCDQGYVDRSAFCGLVGGFQVPSGLVAPRLVGGVGDLLDVVQAQRAGLFGRVAPVA